MEVGLQTQLEQGADYLAKVYSITVYSNMSALLKYYMSLSATCGAPPSPSNGFVDFTNVIEGSEAAFRCDSGPEMTAVCTASGEWVPNPGDFSCDTGRPSSTLAVVGFVMDWYVHVNTQLSFCDFI